MGRFEDHEEEYRGMVLAFVENAPDQAIEVNAHISGHFSPLTGNYRWVGRLDANEQITQAYEAGARKIKVRHPNGPQGEGVLGPTNPWGGHSVNGEGRPPYPLPHVFVED